MCKNELAKNASYMISNEDDDLWGITVTTVGQQSISQNDSYPPKNHPKEYNFNVDKGRILNEFQLLYITQGEGVFTFGKNKQSCLINEGKMFFNEDIKLKHIPINECNLPEYVKQNLNKFERFVKN